MVGSSLALAGALIERGEWEDVRALASFLAGAGEESAATELRIRLGEAVWEAHREHLRAISNNMPPAAIELAINALRAILREVPEEFPDRNREVNCFLPPLASAIYAIMQKQGPRFRTTAEWSTSRRAESLNTRTSSRQAWTSWPPNSTASAGGPAG